MKANKIDSAKVALEKGHFAKAKEILEQLLEEDEEDPDVLVLLGLAYLQTEAPKKALEILTRAEELVEEHSILCLFLGRAYKALGKYEDASDYLMRCVTLDPDLVEAWIDLSTTYILQFRYGEAARVLEDAVIRFPEECSFHSMRALVLYKLGDYTESVQEWRTMCQLTPDSLVAHTNLAYSCLLLGLTEEAQLAIERVRQLAPSSPTTRLLEAELAFQLQDLRTAEKLFNDVLSVDANNTLALIRLAVISHICGDEARRRENIETACRLSCDDREGWQKITQSLTLLGEYDCLLNCLEIASHRDRGSAAVWISLAEEYTRRGMLDKASAAWARSVETRGYIKAHCNHCDSDFKIPLHSDEKFHSFNTIQCVYCGLELRLPEALARI